MTATLATSPAPFLVRHHSSWRLCPVGGDPGSETTLHDILHLLGAGRESTPPPSLPADPAETIAPLDPIQVPGSNSPAHLGPEDVVTPAWAWTGRILPPSIVIESAGGERHALDADDMSILDSVTGPSRVGDIVRSRPVGNPPDAALARIARLVGRGLLLPSTDPLAPPDTQYRPPEAGSTAEPGIPWTGEVSFDPNDRRCPVYAVWFTDVGPLLSLGMLTAAARHHGDGSLQNAFDLRRPELPDTFLEHQERRSAAGLPPGAVLLLSAYVWNIGEVLRLAAVTKERFPHVLTIVGGPSAPKGEADADEFLRLNPQIDILARGEGEETICDLLDDLAPSAPSHEPRWWLCSPLAQISGLTFRDENGRAMRTADRPRLTDLDEIPSPYLTGEFDHIPITMWNSCLSIETNRGCPYGCTFCDWGSATLSRIRRFGLDRVRAELEWAARRGAETIQICDANFGIFARDIEIAAHTAEIHRTTGFPHFVSLTPAKNTMRHIRAAIELFLDGGVGLSPGISLQTVDPETLTAVRRENIRTDSYLELAADLRRRGNPLQGDLILGLPGQTYESYKNDLQFFCDHEIDPRTWPLLLLPNSPMNEPDYRSRYAIVSDEAGIVQSTSSFSASDRQRMDELRKAHIITDRLGVLRHVMRFLQWEHGLTITDVMEEILAERRQRPAAWPHLAWLLDYFDDHPVPPVGWGAVYAEVRSFLTAHLGIPPSSALDSVLTLQQFLMPRPGRRFPETVTLAHDYPEYYRQATATLYTTGAAPTLRADDPEPPASSPSTGPGPLRDFPPGEFTVTGDPLGLCRVGPRFGGTDRGTVIEGGFWLGTTTCLELASPLAWIFPATSTFEEMRRTIAAWRTPPGAAAHARTPPLPATMDERLVQITSARRASTERV